MSVPTLTSVQIANEALERLGAKAVGVAAPPAHHQKALGTLRSIYDQMRRKGRANFDIDAVPGWAQDPLKSIVAFALTIDYGVSPERYQALKNADAAARKTMGEQNQSADVFAPVKVKPF